MDIERQDFEEAFKQTDYYIAHGDSSTLMLCGDRYALDDVQVAFEMWQAAKADAVPEGFVVALKEPDLKMIEAAAQEHAENGASYRTMYKAMIEAGEKK